jgi:dipeptidyl aminopeptidase/acylaminoacyl peptidase
LTEREHDVSSLGGVLSALLSAALMAAPAAGAATVPVERPVSIPTSDGLTLSGTVSVPSGPGPHPAAVLVGGFGPSNRDGSLDARGNPPYRDIARALTERGIMVLRYDKRGIGRSQGATLAWLDARPLASDAVAATRRLVALPGVDTRRVTLIGHSQGGDLALQAARTAPATRVVALSAPGRRLGLLPRASGTASRLLTRLIGSDVARATLGRDPRPDAAAVRQPVMLVHGTRDRTVPISDMGLLASARQDAGRRTTTLTVPGAGHFLQVEGRVPARALDAVAAFAD